MMSCGCGGGGCGGGGCLDFSFGKKKKEAFQGLPYDSSTYYAGGLAQTVETVRNEFNKALGAGGIHGVKVEPWIISMSKWFSEKREYLEVKYGGVQVYVLVIGFGSDLYASWISFFNLGCLQRLTRFGKTTPTDMDVDDLEMLGQAIDVYLRDVLDRVLRGAGFDADKVQQVFTAAKRKKFVKA
jgi:hypothetical protein